jgi:stage V sporulation protein R
MRELDLFQHDKKGKDRVITHISSPDDWKIVKESLLRSVGLGNIPVIKILEVRTNGAQEMVLCHEFDGRELDAEYADRTLRYVQQLWGKKVILETRLGGECCQMSYDGQGDKVDVSRS